MARQPAAAPVPPATGNMAELQQRFFGDALAQVEQNRKKFRNEAALRRFLAYTLKAISLFGAVIVAAKISFIPQTALGLIIAAAVAADQLTSNHERLLALVQARYAADRLMTKVQLEHSQKLPAILAVRNTDPQAFLIALETLCGQLYAAVIQGQESILDGLRDADLKSLKNLYIDVRSNR